jgi:zinc protease
MQPVNMKKLSLYLLFISVLLAQCTPKTGETISKAPETPKVEAPKPATFRSTAPAAGPAPRIQMGEAEQFALDNGLQVILVENHKLPRVSYQLFVDVPALTEKEAAGTIQIAGDMLSKGTKTKSKSEIDESIDFIGASLSTNPNGMFGATLKKYNESLLAIMSDVLLNPSFPSAEFDKIKKQYASGLTQEKEDPDALSQNLSSKLIYGANHPYGELPSMVSKPIMTNGSNPISPTSLWLAILPVRKRSLW